MPSRRIPEPWHSFLSAIDAALQQRVEFECLGGFVVTALYGLQRPTADVDVLSIAPGSLSQFVLKLAGEGSQLHRRFGVYLQYVTVASISENYEDRLWKCFLEHFQNFAC